MMQAAVLLLLVFTDAVTLKKVCSYQDVLDHLNLTTDNNVFRLTRPVLDHTQPTIVELDIILFAILSVRWNNHRISWDPEEFCGITKVSVPQDILWKPDLCIYEMIQKDESPLDPYVEVTYDGHVASDQDVKVVSTCKMDIHKFPFDTQSCNITIGSANYCAKEMRLVPFSNSSRATQFSRELIKTQGEWEFLQLSVTRTNFSIQDKIWENLIYTFTMKRRPLLYVINFLLPIVFFLTLDLASFFIADQRGEKLGFKVTVLLAISVLLLILNDILPSMSNKTPLIATYCIVIFALMLLSLLETILVTYLLDKSSQEKLRVMKNCEDKQGRDDRKSSCCSCICKASGDDHQGEVNPVAEEVNTNIQPGDGGVLMLILEQQKELQKTLNLHLGRRGESCKLMLLAARINKAFFFFYVAAVSVFLLLIFAEWSS
ncbi:5-hydroxytryptamine receptor 3A-like [Takifugu rubripes]|uniref:5-hydroxytryptamine receptor 3A-like n=1 Tax=Takifugu rubripes TaxID=31033 RepID=UPI001145BC70|nr:5-hydroxytryptamine receptor 3A-like [Takifugu rubripes]